jgi:hypothetical protein
MFCNGGYFPGSLSNDYWKWTNGKDFEDSDKKMGATCGDDKITLCQKFTLGITGYVLGVSLLLSLASGMNAAAGQACDGNLSGAANSFYLALFAYIGKAKELVCYYILFCAYCVEYALYCTAILCPSIRGFDSWSQAMCEGTACRKNEGSGLENQLYKVYGWVWKNVG